MGFRSTKPEHAAKPMRPDTILAMASCTKLMTAIAVLQCVERGFFSLDEDVGRIVPELGEVAIVSGPVGGSGAPRLQPKKGPITLRHLLTHSSGSCYDQLDPLLLQWRADRGEAPWSAATVESRCNSPLVFEPGTSWMYGMGADWAGKMVERVTGQTLEVYMSKHIWDPLHLKDTTFWPTQDMYDRMADLSMLDTTGKAVPLVGFDLINGSTDCLGGGGVFASPRDFMALLKAVMIEDSKLLKMQSYEELFTSQLSEPSKQALQALLESDSGLYNELGGNVPLSGHKSWSLGGLLSLDRYPGWMGENTLLWQGMPNIRWFIDREVGLCGLVAPQLIARESSVMPDISARFQREIYAAFAASKSGT